MYIVLLQECCNVQVLAVMTDVCCIITYHYTLQFTHYSTLRTRLARNRKANKAQSIIDHLTHTPHAITKEPKV